MTPEQKRAFVAEMYPSLRWKKKVAKMSDSQVFAIYMREQKNPTSNHSTPPKESDDAEPPF